MKFYTNKHKHYCGIDLHARNMYVCILNQDEDVVYHRNIHSSADQFLKAIKPYRDDLVVAVECMFCWYWLADLCAKEGIEFVLGHALCMKTNHYSVPINYAYKSLTVRIHPFDQAKFLSD